MGMRNEGGDGGGSMERRMKGGMLGEKEGERIHVEGREEEIKDGRNKQVQNEMKKYTYKVGRKRKEEG